MTGRYNGPARPAINVKVHAAGLDFWPPTPGNIVDAVDRHVGAAYERVQSDFWQAAQEIATQRGLGEIAQEGRSGGWLVFLDYDPIEDPTDDDKDPEVRARWLTGYAAMTEWAEAFIADAPRKVRELAQSLAMDEAGERAALRMFATFRAVTA